MENWNEVKWKYAWEQAKAKTLDLGVRLKEKTLKTVEWVKDNPQASAIIAATVIEASKLARKGMDAHDRRQSERRYYDRSSQQYMRLKRRMTEREKSEAWDRHQAGETYTEIYKSMGLL